MEKVSQKEQVAQLEELLQKCTRFLPWTEIAKLIYGKGFRQPIYTAHEIYERLSAVECPSDASALDYALKLNAEWDKIFEKYGEEKKTWIENIGNLPIENIEK